MHKYKVVISECYYEDVAQEREILENADAELIRCDCKTEDEVIAAAKDCDALLCQFVPVTRRVIESLTKCRVIVRYAIGVDNIDVQAAEECGIPVCNVPDYSIDEVSNTAIALLMDCAKKLTYFAGQVKRGHTSYVDVKPLRRMQGSTLGLVGFGRIPRTVAKKMSGFGLNIIAYDPYIDAAAAKELNVTPVTFEELLKQSDYVSVHCPLTGETRHMFDRAAFEKMKRTAIFINTARGAVVCEEDLIWALQNGIIAGAGIDVLEHEPVTPDHPLLQLDNAVVTPHTAWYSEEALRALQRLAAEEVARALTGKPLRCPVNHPKR